MLPTGALSGARQPSTQKRRSEEDPALEGFVGTIRLFEVIEFPKDLISESPVLSIFEIEYPASSLAVLEKPLDEGDPSTQSAHRDTADGL